jgi:hypothetical protein
VSPVQGTDLIAFDFDLAWFSLVWFDFFFFFFFFLVASHLLSEDQEKLKEHQKLMELQAKQKKKFQEWLKDQSMS